MSSSTRLAPGSQERALVAQMREIGKQLVTFAFMRAAIGRTYSAHGVAVRPQASQKRAIATPGSIPRLTTWAAMGRTRSALGTEARSRAPLERTLAPQVCEGQ